MVREASGSENPGETVLTSGEMTPLSSAASQILKMARVIDAEEAADVKAKPARAFPWHCTAEQVRPKI